MHWNVHNAVEDGKNLVEGFVTFFKFEVLVPKRMGEEVETNAVRSTFKKPKKKEVFSKTHSVEKEGVVSKM